MLAILILLLYRQQLCCVSVIVCVVLPATNPLQKSYDVIYNVHELEEMCFLLAIAQPCYTDPTTGNTYRHQRLRCIGDWSITLLLTTAQMLSDDLNMNTHLQGTCDADTVLNALMNGN